MKKYQIFLSSTIEDLKYERNELFKSIIEAGHIPAGMEFFTECTDSLSLIYKWIDDSDIFLLLLGGRYGTIEEKSKLGFVELEYKYALKKNKSIIVLKLSDKYIRTENKPKENLYLVITLSLTLKRTT